MTVSPEHGKRYNTRDGQVTEAITKSLRCGIYSTFAGYHHNWRSDGRYCGDIDNPFDLVSEYIEPTEEPAWIEWHGGECPIKSDKTLVDYRLADLIVRRGARGRQLRWSRYMLACDITSYRITENHEPTEPAPIDMSQNRVQWGLLTDAEQAALEEWAKGGKKVVRLVSLSSQWVEAETAKISMYTNMIYRTVSPPVITEDRQDISTAAGHLVTVILTLHDGKPISGTVVV